MCFANLFLMCTVALRIALAVSPKRSAAADANLGRNNSASDNLHARYAECTHSTFNPKSPANISTECSPRHQQFIFRSLLGPSGSASATCTKATSVAYHTVSSTSGHTTILKLPHAKSRTRYSSGKLDSVEEARPRPRTASRLRMGTKTITAARRTSMALRTSRSRKMISTVSGTRENGQQIPSQSIGWTA